VSACASFFVTDAASARARVAGLAGLARWVELRLDRAPEMDFAALFHELALPAIATCPRIDEGGHYSGSVDARAARLAEAARGGARFVDVPLGVERPAGLPAGTGLVHSWHERPGERADLRERLHRIESRLEPGDVAKIVAWADDHSEAMRVLALYGTTHAPLVAFAMGPGGRATRAWAPVWGAPWTYAAADASEPTAPGQWSLQELLACWPPGGPTPGTSLYGVVGNPIGHSRSPLLWNTALRMARLDAFYLPLEPARFEGFLHAHSHAAFQGFSITAPFKQLALAAAKDADPVARAVGAANTLLRGPAGWQACNTDGPAAIDALAEAGMPPGAAVLVLGAGGAARAAVFEAARRGHAVHVAARHATAAAALAADLEAALAEQAGAGALTCGALADADPAGFQAVVQATPVGGAAQPGNLLAARSFAPGTCVLDMVYAPECTALLAQAAEQGAVGVPGHRMLVLQMVAQFALFTGQQTDPGPLTQVVRADLAREK